MLIISINNRFKWVNQLYINGIGNTEISIKYVIDTRGNIKDIACLLLNYKQYAINKLGINSGIY